MFRTILLLLAFGLAACAASPDRYAVDVPPPQTRERIAFASLEIRDVTLPAYAAADEISRLEPDGRVVSDGSVLWADTPNRAISLELARVLVQMTGARVASSPWPLETLPDARLDLRFETLLARPDGLFVARGQYFVAVPEGRERSGLFDLQVVYDPAAGPGAIAAARGTLISELGRFLARSALR